jgi:hypothetical protein
MSFPRALPHFSLFHAILLSAALFAASAPPAAAHDAKGQRRKLRVRVSRQGVSVRARESYIYDPPS